MRLIIIACIVFSSCWSQGAGVKSFIKTCAVGTLIGAAAGVASLALEKNPSDSWNNVAKGASLGLYGGIGYGLYQLNKESEPMPTYSIAPQFSAAGRIEGVQWAGTIFEF